MAIAVDAPVAFPRIATQGNHFVVHCDEHSTIVEDDGGPLDKARAQFWLGVMRERKQTQGRESVDPQRGCEVRGAPRSMRN